MKYLLYIILFTMTFTFSNAKWEYYNDSNSLIKLGTSSIVVDYNNTVWVKTGGGIVAIDGDNWTLFDSTDSEHINKATDLTIDIYGNLWFVSNGNIVTYENNEFIKKDSLNGAQFIEFDSDNNYWISVDRSIYKKEGNEFIEKYHDYKGENSVASLIINGNDNVYFSRLFNGDLCQIFNDGSIVCLDKNNSEIPNPYSISSFATDSNGNIWVGGLFYSIQGFDGSTWTKYDSLKTNDNTIGRKYKSIGFDKNNILWAICNPRLSGDSYLFRIGKNIESYTLETTLYDPIDFNVIYDLAIDFNGNVWVTSNMGLFKFTPELTNVEEDNTNDNRHNISYKVDNIEIISSVIISKIEIFDLMGSSLLSVSNIDNYEFTINTNSLMKGLYILRVNNTSYKFLKR